jgi:hypothetical protein
MPSVLSVGQIAAALGQRLFPSITTWNRLEARPRSQTFDRALRAEVRDALWMLTRQWQMGEFQGSDAGSPVFVRTLLKTTRFTKYQSQEGTAGLLGASAPLDVVAERRPVSMRRKTKIISLDLRLVLARQWFALIADLGDFHSPFQTAYPIAQPDPANREDADICAHPEDWATFQAIAGRAMDGGALLEYLLAEPSHQACDGTGIDPVPAAAVNGRATHFLAFAARLLRQPETPVDDAWSPQSLGYEFSVSAPLAGGTEKVYSADGYASAKLDWYSLDVDQTKTLGSVPGSDQTGLPADAPSTTIPIPITFSGMPNTRWWAFEDHSTNFGNIDASTTDLAKLLFIEFALVYSNDWFVVPCTLPSGTLASVRGLAVTNVFGERLWVEPAAQTADASWGRWAMFTSDVLGAALNNPVSDPTLLLLPIVSNRQTGDAREEVYLVRDEVANMAWGVETKFSLPGGITRSGNETAKQTVNFLQSLIPGGGTPPVLAADVRYQVLNSVPENWIPLIPVHVANDTREVQLQRAAMPRVLTGDPNPPEKVQPLTSLLRPGLDQNPAQPYFLHEEEVPRAGARLTQCFSRTRWTKGEVLTWLRTRKTSGRGEASSGLAFDRLVDKNGNER